MTALHDPLSPRERVVLRRLAEGLTQPAIAKLEFLGLETVRTQSKSIFRKLGVPNAASAVDAAHLLGLLPNRASGSLTPEQKHALATEWLSQPEVAQLAAAKGGAS